MSKEKLLQCGKHIARVLKEEGVEYQFGVTGGHIFPMNAGLGLAGIKLVHCRHEQTGAYAADAYARTSGKLGVCFGTAGPGMTNTVSGVAQAFWCKSPILALYGQHSTYEDGRDALQEGYAKETVGQYTKWTRRIVDPTLTSYYTKKACTDALAYPPGPVAIEIPLDIQARKTPVSRQQGYVANAFEKPAPVQADPASVEKAVKSLLEAERPVVVGGEGVFWAQAGDELKALVEFLQIPVITRRVGRGAVPENHPLAFSGRARGKILRQADVAVTIGLRLGYLEGFGAWAAKARLIQINEAVTEIETTVPSDMVIIANPKAALQQMLECAKTMVKEPPKRAAWLGAVDQIKQKEKERMEDAAEACSVNKPIHPTWVAKCCVDVLDDSATVIFDAFTGSAYMTERVQAKFPGTILDSGNWAGVGHGVGMGIGAQIAKPGKQVMVIMGDGGMGLGGFDVETAARCQLPVVYVLHDNSAWMSAMGPMFKSMMPTVGTQDPYTSWSMLPTRYDHLFAAVGAHTERVEDPEELLPALQRAFESGKAAVVDVVVDRTAPHPMMASMSAEGQSLADNPMMAWMDPEDVPEMMRGMLFGE